MVDNHFQRHNADFHQDPKIGRIFLASLLLHLAVVLIFSGAFTQRRTPPKRPVYYVDLTQLPVANPRAGRPDGQSGAPKAAQEAPRKAPQNSPAPVQIPAQKIQEPVPAVKKTAPPTPAKTTAKPAKTTATASQSAKAQTAPKSTPTTKKSTASTEADYQTAMGAVDKLRRKQEMDALKQKLAALSGVDSRAGTATGGGGGSSAPLGMPDGTGDQIGVSQELWLQERLTKNWSLSKYQVVRRAREARVRIRYNADGVLTGKKFLKPSGDSTFDDSVTRAIFKKPAA
ncbi:MAG: TonB C-terminal domain-containing protein [Syntrophotaleaceae bacterium]